MSKNQEQVCFACSQEQWCDCAYDYTTCPYDGPYDGAVGQSEKEKEVE